MMSEPRASAVPGLEPTGAAWSPFMRVIWSPGVAPVSHASSTEPFPCDPGAPAAPAVPPATAPIPVTTVRTARSAIAADTNRPWIRTTSPPNAFRPRTSSAPLLPEIMPPARCSADRRHPEGGDLERREVEFDLGAVGPSVAELPFQEVGAHGAPDLPRHPEGDRP